MFDPYMIVTCAEEDVKLEKVSSEDGYETWEYSFPHDASIVETIYWYQFKYWKLYFSDVWERVKF